MEAQQTDSSDSARTAKVPLPSPREELSFAERLFLAIDNPVLRRELLTALRSQKAFMLHFVFLVALGAVVYYAWPAAEIATQDKLASELFRKFGESMMVLLSLLSPAFSASAMTIEKERRCMDLLMTAPIRPGTILMGKYLSSVVYLLLLVLSTAPLVAVIFWLPGVGPSEVAGLYVLLIAIAFSFGMLGLTCSIYFHRSQSSLSIAYMLVLPLALLLLVCASEFDGFFVIEAAAWPAGILFIAAFAMYRVCLARLRQPFDPVFKAAEEEDVTTQTGLVLVRDRFPDNLLAPARSEELLPDGVNPVYQKEIRCEVFGRGTLFLRLIIQISMFLSVVFLTFLYMGKEYVLVDYLLVFSMLVAPAFACSTFTQERERGTLDLLLTTLVRPGQVIAGKFLACMRLSLFLTGLVGVTLFLYLFVGSNDFAHRAGWLIVYLLLVVSTIIFETTLAMFFSLIFRSTVQSMVTTYTVLLLLFGVPVAAGQLLLTFTQRSLNEINWVLFTSPFEAVYTVATHEGETAALERGMLWPWYLLFSLGMSGVLLAGIAALYERRCLEQAAAR